MDSQMMAIKDDFIKCQQVFQAIGDETRQAILLALMETTCQNGLRVGEIKDRTHISRPSASHHLKVLLEAGVIMRRKEKTMSFYYIDVRSTLGLLHKLLAGVDDVLRQRHSQ